MILITGWTGNTGSLVFKKIRQKYPDKKIVGISRTNAHPVNEYIMAKTLDLANEASVREIFQKYHFETIIHIANIRYSRLLMHMAEEFSIPHIILVHTTGIYSQYRAYSSLYQEIEKSIFENTYSKTSFTILRPTMIYGNRRDHNMHKLIKFLSRFPIFPLFGDGSALMQPVHVEDLSTAIVDCVDNERVKNKEYDLSGGSVMTYKQILHSITALLQKRVVLINIPIKLAIFFATIYSRLTKNPIISIEQVQRLQEDKAYSHDKASTDLGYRPRTFGDGIRQEVLELRKEGLIK